MTAAGPWWSVVVFAVTAGTLAGLAGRRGGRAAVVMVAAGLATGPAAPLALPCLLSLLGGSRHPGLLRATVVSAAVLLCWMVPPWVPVVAVSAPWVSLVTAAVGAWFQHRSRRVVRIAAAVTLSAFVACVAVVTVGVLRLWSAVASVDAAVHRLEGGSGVDSATEVVARAGQVAHLLDSPGIRFLAAVPGISPYAVALVDSAPAAVRATESAQLLVSRLDAEPLLAAGPRIDAVSTRKASGDTDHLAAATADLADAAGSLVEHPFVVESVAARASSLSARLTEVSQGLSAGSALLAAAAQLTGDSSRVLVLAANPAEARGTVGVVGGYAVVSTDGRSGVWSLDDVGRVAELNRALDGNGDLSSVPELAEPLGKFGIAEEWRNLTMGADAVAVARAAVALAPRSGVGAVDAAAVVSPEMLAALLQWAGPVSVSSWPVPVSAENVTQVVEQDQYARFSDPGMLERDTFLVDLLQATWGQIGTTGGLPDLDAVRAISSAMDRHHLVLWAADGRVDALLSRVPAVRRLDAGSRMPGVERFSVVVNNAAANKLDPHLERVVNIELPDRASGELVATVTLTNVATEDLPQWVLGLGDAGIPSGHYRAWLTFLTDRPVVSITVGGVPARFERACQAGTGAFSGYIRVLPGTSQTVRVVFGAGPAADSVEISAQPGPRDRATLHVDGAVTVGTTRHPYAVPEGLPAALRC